MNIQAINNNKIVTVYNDCGMGKAIKYMALKNSSINFKTLKETEFYYIVTREGVTRYTGNALIAIYEGKEGVHFLKFKTEKAFINHINNKLTAPASV